MSRRAEIAGAGFAGLAAAAALARRGWQVRAHERAPALRGGGFAIGLQANGIRVLKALGAFEEAVAGAAFVTRRETRDGAGRTSSVVTYKDGMYRGSRRRILAALENAARRAGAEIAAGSTVAGVEPDGMLRLADGGSAHADLVIVADGLGSGLRDGLGLLAQRRPHSEGALRLVLPGGLALLPQGTSLEYWSGRRRVILAPSGPAEIYVAMSCPVDDATGRLVPIDAASWGAAFPALRTTLERIAEEADWSGTRWVRYETVRLERWSAGRAAVLGDAAHAMAPNLGQGALCAMMAALGLAVALDEHRDIAAALAAWEARERPLIDHAQRMSALYGRVALLPPALRSAAFWATARIGFLREPFTRAARHVPTGA